MSEMSKIIRSYFLSVIITVLITLIFCGVFIAKNNTDAMLFGVAKNTAVLYNLNII